MNQGRLLHDEAPSTYVRTCGLSNIGVGESFVTLHRTVCVYVCGRREAQKLWQTFINNLFGAKEDVGRRYNFVSDFDRSLVLRSMRGRVRIQNNPTPTFDEATVDGMAPRMLDRN